MDKKFDGQNNVLIQKLIESPYHNNKSTIGQRLITGLKDLSIEGYIMVASNAFKDIEGTDYYPQI